MFTDVEEVKAAVYVSYGKCFKNNLHENETNSDDDAPRAIFF
jgi:hypothetical protein